MLAVIESGGKQYMVSLGSVIEVEKLDAEIGSDYLQRPLAVFNNGVLQENNANSVKLKVLAHRRTKKVIVFKKKRRSNYRRKHGHRQSVTVLQTLSIG